jgi:hypothetical protein
MPAMSTDVPAKIEKVAATPVTAEDPKPEVKESTEEVTAVDKKVKAKVTETTMNANGMKTVSKVWMSDEIPGGMVKMETTMDGAMKGSSTMTVTKMTIK